jgi:toxin ParE1/3/4
MQLTITPRAEAQLDAVFARSLESWGFEQATRYSDGILAAFDQIVAREVVWRDIPPELGVRGFRRRVGHHYIYWPSSGGTVVVLANLRERMDQAAHFESH